MKGKIEWDPNLPQWQDTEGNYWYIFKLIQQVWASQAEAAFNCPSLVTPEKVVVNCLLESPKSPNVVKKGIPRFWPSDRKGKAIYFQVRAVDGSRWWCFHDFAGLVLLAGRSCALGRCCLRHFDVLVWGIICKQLCVLVVGWMNGWIVHRPGYHVFYGVKVYGHTHQQSVEYFIIILTWALELGGELFNHGIPGLWSTLVVALWLWSLQFNFW